MSEEKISKTNVMIVEDESIVALDLKRRLVAMGYEVSQTAHSAKMCFEKLESYRPDIILMDIILKGDIDGIEAAQIIRTKYNLPVLFLTAHNDENTLNRAKKSEPYGYILKPFEVRDLKDNIEIALYKFKMEAKLKESELNYRTLFQTATDAILTLNNHGLVSSFNNKAEKMFNLNAAELERMHISHLIPGFPALGPNAFPNHENLSPANIKEFTAVRKEGGTFPVEVSFSKWEAVSEVKQTLIIRDITTRKQAESIIRQSNLKLQNEVALKTNEINALIDQSPFGIRIFNKSGDVVFKNRAFEKIAGLGLETFNNPKNVFEDNILIRYNYLDKINKLYHEGGEFETKPIYFDPVSYEGYEAEGSGLIFVYRYYSLTDEYNKVYSIVNFIENVTSKMVLDETNKTIADINKRTSVIFETLEAERKRISQELHDSIGQMLFAIKYNIEAFEKINNIEASQLSGIKELLNNVNKELRNIISQLRPSILENYGIMPAIGKLMEIAAESSKAKFVFKNGVDKVSLSKDKEINIYRIIQEALNNTVKHSKATNVSVITAKMSKTLNIIVEDDGIGFAVKGNQKDYENFSYGIAGMLERANAIDASLYIESSPGSGTKITLEIPLEK
jgi:PAS domain S-box-containing protein